MPTKQTARPKEQPKAEVPQRDLQAAYEAHTLVQMIYAHMAMTHAWPTPSPTFTARDPAPTPAYGPWVQPGWRPGVPWSRL